MAEQQLRQGAEQRLTAQTIQTVKATQESHAAAQHNAALRQECADCRQEARQLCCMLGTAGSARVAALFTGQLGG